MVFAGPPDYQNRALVLIRRAFCGRIKVMEVDEQIVQNQGGKYPLKIIIREYNEEREKKKMEKIIKKLNKKRQKNHLQ